MKRESGKAPGPPGILRPVGSRANSGVLARMSGPTVPTLAALVIGLAAGATAHRLGEATLLAAADSLEPIGSLWTGALRLLAVPLVVCVLMTRIAGLSGGKGVGLMGATSLAVFASILLGGAAVALFVAQAAISVLPLEKGAGVPADQDGALVDAAPAQHWMEALVPGDLPGAVARGDLLAIVVVAIVFALAASRLQERFRRDLLALFEGATQSLFVILSWLIVVAPITVFSLAFSMSSRGGASVAGHLGAFVGVLIATLALLTLAMYPLAWGIGRVPLVTFARGLAPAQIVAASTRSSLASLPALLQGAARIGLPAPVAGFVLPLCVAALKANSTANGIIKLYIMAHMYGIPLSPGTIATYVLATMLLSVATPGIPSGGLGPNTPALLAAGMPMEGIILFSTVDALPDVFTTVLNVTADMTTATIVTRVAGARSAAALAAVAARVAAAAR